MNALAFVSYAIITRTLGAESYGLFVLATRIIDFVAVISTLGFVNTIIRYVSSYVGKGDYARAKGTILYSAGVLFFIAFFIAIILFFASNLISVNIFKRTDLPPLLRILIISIPFSVAGSALLSSLIGLKLIKQHVSILNVFSPLFYLAGLSITFLLGYRVLGLTLVLAMTSISIFFLALFVVRQKFLNKQTNVRPIFEKKKLWSFSWPLFLNQLFQKAVQFMPIFVMGLYLKNSDIGIYNISFRIALMVSILLSAFRLIFSPTISGLFAKQNTIMISKLYKATTKWAFTFSLVVVSVIALFGGTLLGIFGGDFTQGLMVLLVISLGEMVSASCGLVGNLIVMSGRPKVAFINSFVSFIIVLLLCFMLIPAYGILGAAFSYALSVVLMNFVRVSEIYYFEKLQPFNISYLKPMISALIGFGIVESIKGIFGLNLYFEMIAGSAVFLLIYGLSIWLLRIDDEDRYVLDTIFKRFKKTRP
jgi:O-antigen/teichoic acid export membrane protein